MKNYIKCAAIYYQQTSQTTGYSSGSAIGFAGNGLGVGTYSGSSRLETQSELADLFRPVSNYSINNSNPMIDFIPVIPLLWIATAPDRFLSNFLNYNTNNQFILGALSIACSVPAFFIIINVFSRNKNYKYNDSQMERMESNYNEIYYDPNNHTIFKQENNQLPANRKNFVKLIIE